MPEKKWPLNCLLVVLEKRNQQDLAIFLNFQLMLVGYEMIVANSARKI